MNKKWVILDRDGTIIVDRGYLGNPAGVELLRGAAEGLSRLCRAGYLLTVVTNQSGVGRGFFTEEDSAAVNNRMTELLSLRGVTLTGIYSCFHAPEANCACRKPKTGLVDRAMADLKTTRADIACVAGDKKCDMELAHALGTTGLLIGSRDGEDLARACFQNLSEMAAWLLDGKRSER